MKLAVDTNVLLRYLVEDDPQQTAKAAEAIEAADTIFVSLIVLCETVWVLSRSYRRSRGEIAAALRSLITSRNVDADRPAAEAGLATLEAGGDFADGVIQYDTVRNGCDRLATFDERLAALFDPAEVLLLSAARSG